MPKRLAMVLTVLFTVGVGTMWGAEEVYKETIFNSSNNSEKISSYSNSWSNTTNSFKINITNANNNNNGWTYIKMGSKNNASTGTIITASSIDKKITKVSLNIGAITSSDVTSIKLYKSTNNSTWVEIGSFSKNTNWQNVVISDANQGTNLYYKIEAVCLKASSNGPLQINGLRFYIEDTPVQSYTVNWTINPTAGGTLSAPSGNSTTVNPNAAYTYGSPAYTVTSGSATVSKSGNTFTATPTANSTIQINMVEKQTHTITWMSNGVQYGEKQIVVDGQAIGILPDTPPACSSKYSTFVGWYTLSSGTETTPSKSPQGVKVTESTIPNDDATYYAVWADGSSEGGEELKTTLDFSSNVDWKIPSGSSNKTVAENQYSNGTYTIKLAGSTNNGYYYNSNQVLLGKNGAYLELPAFSFKVSKIVSTTPTATVSGAVTWNVFTGETPVSSPLTGCTSGGTFEIDKDYQTEGTIYTIKVTNANNLQIKQLEIYESVSGATGYITTCTTQTSVTLNPNGGEIANSDWTLENGVYKLTTNDESITLPEITRAGYTFDGWATSAGGSKAHDNGATITLNGTPVTLYAIWTPITYTITYELDGGTNHASNPANYTIETEAITLQDPNKTNHNFVGWYKESTFATQVTQIEKGSTGNITLYAKWEEIPTNCTVTYDANGGEGTITDATKYTNGATVTVLGNFGKFTNEGYAFTGWNTKADGSGDSYKHNDQFTITTNTTLYAQWCSAHWVLVTNTSEIEDDTRIIIAAKDYNVALSTTQNDNNRGQATITKKYNTVTFGADVQTLSAVGPVNNNFALYSPGPLSIGYLYAASSSSNQLKTKTTPDNNCYWSIGISETVASIYAQGDKTHNQIKYNHQQSGQLFSCYESTNTTMSAVAIYKEVCVQDQYNVNEPKLTNATAANTNPTTVASNATSLTLNYSANAGYLLPETITVKMGGVALSSTDDYTWNKETGDLTISVTGFYGDIDVKIVAEEDPCYGFAMSTVISTSTTNSITLTWTEVAGATGYKVRLDKGEFTTATGLTHTFEGLSPKTTYNWEVQAVSDICEASKTGSTATQKETFTVSWSVNGTVTSTEPVVDGESIQNTPLDPDDETLEDCGANKFMGWSEKSAGSTPQNAAYYDDLCSAAQMKSKHSSVTGDKTLYAVFATSKETPGQSVEASLSFASTAQRDSQTSSKQVWSNEGITFTNNKGSSTTDVANYSNPVRLYKNSEIIVEHTSGEITKIVFDCNSSAYATALKNSIGTPNSNTTVTASSDKVTVTFANAVASFSAKLTSDQVRMDALTVTAGGGTITTYSNYVTNCCATPVPTNGSYTSPSGTSVTLTWDGESTQYHITGNGLDDYSKEESYTITGLTECDEYTFYVSAYPEGGCESEAIPITAQPFSGAKTVTFNYNGNGQENTTSSTSCGNTSITLPTPSWTDYRFMGWYTAANGGDKVNENPYTPTSDITLYAHWEKEYNVTYNANSGSTTCAGGAYIAGETVTVCTTNPSKTGHTFIGWTYSPSVTITDGKFVMPASDVTITAQWQVESYTVTWNPNGGNWGGSAASIEETYEYGATIVQPAAPQRDDYRFTGWSPAVSATMPAGNKTYTAQWKQNYTITFHDGDDVTPWTQTKDAESINLTEYVGTLACDDYQFAGWSTADTKYNDETANITTWVTGNYTPTANIDLYAVYTKGAVTNDFTLNCAGGVYEIWVNNSAKNHMAGHVNSTPKLYTKEWWNGGCSSCNGTDGTPFTITKIADNTYSIQNADGEYIAKQSSGTHPYVESTWANQDRYKWTISEGTNGSWRFVNKAATDYALVYYNDYFDLCKATSVTNGSTSYYDLELSPAASNVYQSNPNCGPYYIRFETHGGEFIQGEYAYGEEQTGLTETTYSKFPAAELEGYTFAGWKDGSPLDEEITADNPADGPYLKQADEDLIVSSNKTYHAVYYYYDEEEDIDFSKEFITSIYVDINEMQYFLSGTPSSDGGRLSATTDCGSVSEVTITPGTGANAGKYAIKINGVSIAPRADETDIVGGSTAWWTIEERSPGSGEYKISGQDKTNIVYIGGGFGHYKYNQGSDYGANYYYPHFGICRQHHWVSFPTLKPSINLSGDVYVTATNARGVMATSTLKVSAKQLNANEQVNITSNSNDVYFSADRTVNFVKANKPTNTLTITASPSGVIEQEIYVHYKPSIEGNGTPASVVVSANLATPNPSVTDDQTIYVRNLPAKFVIATKVGATWYALPANMNGATNPEGVVIDVDETNMTAIATNTTTYTLWPVKTTATENDRYTNVTGAAYGDRVRFAAVNNNNGLWANNNNNGSAIRNYAKIEALGADALAAYEWKISTTIVNGNWQYTLQTDQPNNQKYLRYWVGATGAPKWGTYAAGNDQLYFLPVTETEPFDYKVVEWYPTKMLIQTDAAIANPTAKIGDEQFNDITCNNKGSKLYEIAGLPLESNPTKVLTIKFSDGGNNYTNATAIPVIISQSATTVSSAPFTTLTKDVYNYADLVVRDGATLTINGGTHAENTFFNVTIYPTSKISVPSDKKLTVHSLTFFGGIDEIYNGSTYTLNKYGVPELSLKGTLKKSISTIDYLMRVDSKQMYSLTVPYDVQLADIKYWDGTNIVLGDELWVSAYDGASRAQNQGNGKNWIYETDFNPATLKAGVGYTISAELQSGVGNEYSILRMPMMSNVENDATEREKKVSVTAHGIDANITDNHKGWNLVGNPYMTSISGGEADSKLVLGYLKETGTGPWEWVEKDYRYVTIPADNGKDYHQQKFTEAVLPPFKNFFVQIGTTGDLQFGLGTRQSMPARSTQAAIEKEVEFEILMSNDARQDNTGLLISEEYSPAYEINADLEKMTGTMSVYTIYGGYKLAYNALSPINASEWIPMGYIAPAAGEYTFRLDDVEKIVEQVEHVYVIDYDANNIVDLMTDEYKFTTNKEQNDNRFAINVVLIQDKDNTTTGLDIINGNNTAPIKFIYHDKIYIKSGEVIYDGTGKQVTNINK